MKKQKPSFKQKLLDVWSKVKRPLFYCSIALNILFVAIAIVGCIVPSKRDGSSTSNVSESIQLPQRKNMLNDNETITDLTNTTWVFNTSVFVTDANTITYNIDFISNNESFNKLVTYWSNSSSDDYAWIGYYYNSTRSVFPFYVKAIPPNRLPTPVSLPFYESNSNYLTIDISGGLDVSNSNLISWLLDNAIQPGFEPEPEPDYNQYEQVNKIFLGDSFVPSVYISQNGDYLFNGFAGKVNNGNTFYLDFDGFVFSSNDTTYNRVRMAFVTLGAGAPYVTLDGLTGISTNDYNDYVYCLGIFYQYLDLNNDVTLSTLVARPRRSVVNVSGANINAYDVRVPFLVWVNDNYRTLDIIEDSALVITNSYLIYSNMTSVQLLQITSNVSQSVTGLTNVTDILKGGFSSLSSILQMNILPGITIGLLLFIPLIVSIILTILKLVKK